MNGASHQIVVAALSGTIKTHSYSISTTISMPSSRDTIVAIAVVGGSAPVIVQVVVGSGVDIPVHPK